jgi:hypothetical protein
VWRKLILALVVVPLGVVLIALAVVNRKPEVLILDPFGGEESSALSLEAPFFLFLLGAFAIGLVVGGIASWLSQGKWRKTAREEARQARDWRRQASRLEQELETLDPAHHRPQLPAD